MKNLFYTHTYDAGSQIVYVTIDGIMHSETMKRFIVEFKSICQGHDCRRMLVDTLNLSSLTDWQRFEIGEFFADVFRQEVKVAVYARSEAINYFFENVAVNRFALVKVGSNKEELMNWLE